MVIACGIDPGLAGVGIAYVDVTPAGLRFLSGETVKTDAHSPLVARLAHVHRAVAGSTMRLLGAPCVVAVELNVFGPTKGGGLALQGRGAILAALHPVAEQGGAVLAPTPQTWRRDLWGAKQGKAKDAEKEAWLRGQVVGLPPKMSDHLRDATLLAVWALRHAGGKLES